MSYEIGKKMKCVKTGNGFTKDKIYEIEFAGTSCYGGVELGVTSDDGQVYFICGPTFNEAFGV